MRRRCRGLFLQQLMQLQIYLGKLVWAQFHQLFHDFLRAHLVLRLDF